MRIAIFMKKCFLLLTVLFLFLTSLPRTASAAAVSAFYTKEALQNATAVDIEVTYNQTEARAMFSLLNQFRTSSETAWITTKEGKKQSVRNLQALTYDYRLEEIAMQRAAEIALRWDHLRPSGTYVITLLNNNGYTNVSVGENLAAGSATASKAFRLLCEENASYEGQGHRRNMLSDKYRAVGIGHAVVGGIHFWAQSFAGVNLAPNPTLPNDSKSIVTIEGTKGYFSNIFLSGGNSAVTLLKGTRTEIPVLNAFFAGDVIVPGVSRNASAVSASGSSTGAQNTKAVSSAAAVKPDKAKNFRARSSIYGVTLTWDQVPGADGYIIYSRVGNTGNFSYKYVITNPAKTNFTDLNASSDLWNFYMIFPYTFNEQGARLVNTASDYVYGKKVK